MISMYSGSEISGDVVEIGAGVKHVTVGQRVFGMSHSMGGYSEEVILDSFVSTNVLVCTKLIFVKKFQGYQFLAHLSFFRCAITIKSD